ncbi:hypothetical protein PpBr36_03167 [Pyricularia pennisetigena]|uniref:hypothetical protein n=1 Tax=Pyricularia pennisetigena TaxID=1578925 RepID=UPI00114F0C4F|nr:hypothetical protein PpBr36_03167 [Pyricularia pennisetigena]TLS30685.1 hypothetical protein PpBr36_03167 [Pyricularia pennisetigena]
MAAWDSNLPSGGPSIDTILAAIGWLRVFTAAIIAIGRLSLVGQQSSPGGVDHALGLKYCILQSPTSLVSSRRRPVTVAIAIGVDLGGGGGGITLLEHLADEPVEPDALEVRGRHRLGARDGAAARGGAAQAGKGLGHVPLGGRVEEGQLLSGPYPLGPDQDGQVGRVEDERGVARVIDVQQVAVEVQVPVPADLHRGVRRLIGQGAGREGHLGVEGERGQSHAGAGHGGELGLIDNDFLDLGWGLRGAIFVAVLWKTD